MHVHYSLQYSTLIYLHYYTVYTAIGSRNVYNPNQLDDSRGVQRIISSAEILIRDKSERRRDHGA